MKNLHKVLILIVALCITTLLAVATFITWNTDEGQCVRLLDGGNTENASVEAVQQKALKVSDDSKSTDLSLRFPFEIDGVDKEGSPVVTLPFGTWNIRGAIDEGNIDKVQQRFHEALEQMEKKVNYLSQLSNGRVSSSVVIYDFKGFTFWQILSFKTINTLGNVIKYYEKNYDIRKLKRWYIINAPGYFYLFFNALRLFSSAQLLSKVEIYGTFRKQWQAVLLEHISPDQLSPRYGGTKRNI